MTVLQRNNRMFFTSDLHLGHKNVIKHCDRPFYDVDEMNNALIQNINDTVGVDDALYIIGDFTATGHKRGDGMRYRQAINCKNVYLVYGNHDKSYTECNCFQGLCEYGELKLKDDCNSKIVMMHYPIASWNWKKYGGIHLHGHIHSRDGYNQRNIENGVLRFDVGVDANDFKPVSFETIRQ